MTKTPYSVLNLPKDLVDELKVWRVAFIAAYRKEMTYADMIRGMLASLPKTNPEVVEEYDKIVEQKKKENNGNDR